MKTAPKLLDVALQEAGIFFLPTAWLPKLFSLKVLMFGFLSNIIVREIIPLACII